MNIQVGKSAGIALLMAAALLAALFTMGVFAPAGVGASVDESMAITEAYNDVAEADSGNPDSLTVTFYVDDTVDGKLGSSTVVDNVIITVPGAKIVSGGTAAVTVTQDGEAVGAASITDATPNDATDGVEITITKAATGGTNLEAGKKVTVTVSDIALTDGATGDGTGGTTTLADATKTYLTSGVILIQQLPNTDMVGIIDESMSFDKASAKLMGDSLVVQFDALRDHGDGYNVVITPNSSQFTGTADVDDSTGFTSTPADDTTVALDAVEATADGESTVTVTGYDEGATIKVTITGLSLSQQALANPSVPREVKIAEGNHLEVTLTLDGPVYRNPEVAEAVADDPVAATTMDVLDTDLADAATKVELTDLDARNASGIRGGNDIVITLPKFHIPASIDEDQIIVEEADDNATPDANGDDPTVDYYGPPESVSVSGDKITITVPGRVEQSDGTGTETNVIDGEYSILIKKSAGIRNPNSDGSQTITVKDLDTGTEDFIVNIGSHISPKPGWVERGDTVTVTAKGINSAGDATVHLLNMGNFDDVVVLNSYHNNTEEIDDIMELEDILNEKLADETLDGEDLAVLPALDRSLRDGGTAVLDFDTSSSIFNAQAQNATENPEADAKGTNILVVVDAGGNVIGHKRLGLQPTVTLNLAEVQRTGRMGVTVSDWYYRDLTDIRVNGIQVRLPDPDDPDDSVVWSDQSPPTASPLTVVVPRRARLGTMEVVVSGTTRVKQGSYSSIDKHVQTVDVGFFNLTITPSTAVTDQVIRIEGTGFGETTCITSIMVGDERIREATTGDRVVGTGDNCVRTDTDGALANSFHVPHNLKPNTYTVVITDALNRVGQGEITVPKPAISLDPEASQRGSTVTVEGENFPAEDVIGISYGADPVTVATTDTVGKWRATFKIPVDATIGNDYKVEAVSEKKGTGQVRQATGDQTVKLSASATHTVPEEILMVEPATGSTGHSPEQISSGQRLRITASNLPLFTPVSLNIGGIGAAGRVIGEDDAADSAGRYERVILVPQLTPGIHTVELTVHNIGNTVVVVEFVEILDIITRPTVDVFEDLIADGILASVWRYKIDETGSDWDSFDPQYVGQPGINDLEFVSTRDIVWIRVTENVASFQGAPLFAGWNLRTLE